MPGILQLQTNLDAQTNTVANTLINDQFTFPITHYNVVNSILSSYNGTPSVSSYTISAITGFVYIKATSANTLLLSLTKSSITLVLTLNEWFSSASAFDSVVLTNMDTTQSVSYTVIYG